MTLQRRPSRAGFSSGRYRRICLELCHRKCRGVRDCPALPDGQHRVHVAGAEFSRLHAAAGPRCSRRGICRAAHACPERGWSSIRCRRHSTSAAWSAGSITTTPGSPPSGGIHRITWAEFSPWRIISVAGSELSWPPAGKPLSVRDVLTAMIKAHEIQGVLALENAFNRVGLDHVILVRVATTAVATHLLGGTKQQIVNALSNAWIDGGALRTYRHAPNAGSRKSWAAGDATSRGVRHALMALRGRRWVIPPRSPQRPGVSPMPSSKASPSALRATRLLRDGARACSRFPSPPNSMPKRLSRRRFSCIPKLPRDWRHIDRIVIETQESAVRIISKTGPLNNPADRDHCLQYMVAVPLIFGTLLAVALRG